MLAEGVEEERAGEAADHEAEREAGDHPCVQRLEGPDVEEHAGLAHHEDEADRHHDRHEDEQGERHPLGTGPAEQHPRRRARSTVSASQHPAIATAASGRRRNATASDALASAPAQAAPM